MGSIIRTLPLASAAIVVWSRIESHNLRLISIEETSILSNNNVTDTGTKWSLRIPPGLILSFDYITPIISMKRVTLTGIEESTADYFLS